MIEDIPTRGADTHRTSVAQRHYEPNGQDELTTAIIYAIAEADGVSPIEVKSPLLYEIVDVPAIDTALFGQDVAGGSRQAVGTFEFQYADYLVRVRSDGWIQVYDQTEADLS